MKIFYFIKAKFNWKKKKNSELRNIHKNYSYLINIIFHILNIENIIEKYKFYLNKNFHFENFLNFLIENFDDKSKYLLDSLYNFTNVYSVNDNSYYLIKGLFMNSLKSYMKIIYNYIFNSVVSPLKENESEKVN